MTRQEHFFSTRSPPPSLWDSRMRLQRVEMIALFMAVLLSVSIGHAIIPEVKKDPCVDLIFCTLKSDKNYCEFDRGSDFVVEVDRNRWNIANEQRNRSIVNEYGDYGCATIRNLRESDTGYYKLYISKEDGRRHLRRAFSLTESVLNNLLNASNFNFNKSKIDERLLVPVYWRRNDTELPEGLQLTAMNGTTPEDYSLALVVTAQDVTNEKTVDVTTPTGTTPPPGNVRNTKNIIIALSVLWVFCVGAIIGYFIRIPANPPVIIWKKSTTFSRISSLPKLESIGGVANPKISVINSEFLNEGNSLRTSGDK